MKKLMIGLALARLLMSWADALMPARPARLMIEVPEIGYSDAEVNMITNVVNGEVGGITGEVRLTYADGTQEVTDGATLRRIHALIVDNQVRSNLFQDTVAGCVRQCWSADYANTAARSSEQWKLCKIEVMEALWERAKAEGQERFAGAGIMVPDNLFAATCDGYFAENHTGVSLWARVDWDTGWTSGTFYYYTIGG